MRLLLKPIMAVLGMASSLQAQEIDAAALSEARKAYHGETYIVASVTDSGFTEWLLAQDPAMWHLVAVETNFDYGEVDPEALRAILNSPEADAWTAYAIFIVGASGIYGQPEDVTAFAHQNLVSGFYGEPRFGITGMFDVWPNIGGGSGLLQEAHDTYWQQPDAFPLPDRFRELPPGGPATVYYTADGSIYGPPT